MTRRNIATAPTLSWRWQSEPAHQRAFGDRVSAANQRFYIGATSPKAAIPTPLQQLKAELSVALARIEPVLSRTNDETWLWLPGHHPIRNPSIQRKNSLWTLGEPDKVYEESATILLTFLLSRFKPSAFFDIGSARGHFARIAASKIDCAPLVHSFEMIPDLAASQRSILETDAFGKTAVVNNIALTDGHMGKRRVWTARSLLFEEPPQPAAYKEAWHRRLKFWLQGNRGRGLRSSEIMLTSVDAFSETASVSPDLIKIDVDGYELKVLKGARRTLLEKRPILLLELHTDKKQRIGATRTDVADFLFKFDYQALLLTDHHNRQTCSLVELKKGDALIDRQETDHILFIHKTTRLPG